MVDNNPLLRQFKQLLKLDASPAGSVLPASLVINGDVDATLLRFLKARQGSLEKAHAMLVKCIRWREQNKIAGCAPKHPLRAACAAGAGSWRSDPTRLCMRLLNRHVPPHLPACVQRVRSPAARGQVPPPVPVLPPRPPRL